MIYPCVPIETWAKQYGIDLTPGECIKCKAKIEFTIPLAAKGYRGVTTDHLSCGEKYRQVRLAPVGDEVKVWRDLLG